jgi:hypothetical protein
MARVSSGFRLMEVIGARCDSGRSLGARRRRRVPGRAHDSQNRKLVAIYKAIKIRQGDNHERGNGNGKDAKGWARESLVAKP